MGAQSSQPGRSLAKGKQPAWGPGGGWKVLEPRSGVLGFSGPFSWGAPSLVLLVFAHTR